MVQLLKYNPNIDVIIMDINMPIMSGPEATKIIKTQHPDIIILGITGETDRKLIKSYVQGGMNDVMQKPITCDKFISHISQYIQLQEISAESANRCDADMINGSNSDFDVRHLSGVCNNNYGIASKLLQKLKSQLNDSVQEFSVMVDKMECREIEILSHKLKGAAAQLGIVCVSKCLHKFAECAKLGDIDAIHRDMNIYEETISHFIENIDVILDSI